MRSLSTALRRRYDRLRTGSDRGTSLMELIVGMSIMSIFMGMFTGAVIMMNRVQNKTVSLADTASQLNQGYLTLDKAVRYAAAISTPGTSTVAGGTGDWYVELRTTHTGAEVCTQFRADIVSQTVQKRAWSPANLPAVPPEFTAVTSSIINGAAAIGAADQPFVLVEPRPDNAPFQQLTINLVSKSGTDPTDTTSESSFTFTAVNSSIPATTSPICQEEGRP